MHANLPSTLLLSLVCLLAAADLSAQFRYDLQPARSENRLSENASRDLIEDRRGFIWIATIDGLNRYDGYRFHTYRHQADDSTSITDNYVSRLFEDSEGRLWIGTYHGLNRYLPDCDCFEQYLDEFTEAGARGTIITGIAEDSDNRLWISAYNGLAYFDSKSEVPVGVAVGPESLLESAVTAIEAATGGGVWLGYESRGLSRYRDGSWTHHFAGDSMGEIKGIYEIDEHRLLLAGRQGAFLADTRAGTLELLREGHFAGVQQVGDRVLLRSYFDGVFRYDQERKSLEPVPVTYRGELVDGDVHIYLRDSKGTVWGAYQGLAKVDVYEQRFSRITALGRGDNDLLLSPEVIGIKGDQSGRMVIATQYSGVIRLVGQPGRWTVEKSDPGLFAGGVLWSFPYLHDNVGWLGGIDEIYRYDLSTDKVTRFPEGEQIKKISRDRKGREWYVDKARGIGRFYGRFPLEPAYPGFDDDRPIDIQEDAAGGLWVLASENLYRYAEPRDSFVRVAQVTPAVPRDEEHRSFIVGKYGDVWIASIEALYRYRFATDTYTQYNEQSGLPNSRVSSMIETERGLWVGTNIGLSYFDYATDSFRNYDVNDGLINTIHLPEAAYRDAAGYLYFGGINGIDYFHPDSLAGLDPHPPRPVLERIRLHSPAQGDPEEILYPDSRTEEPITLSYRSLPLQFDLLALGYSQSRENRYAFMMEGADEEWNEIGSNRSTIYSNLPRGRELRFRIRAASHDGVWSKPVSYRLYVRPPFWETIWFRVLMVAIGALALIGAYRYRLQQIRRHNRYLESEIARKTTQVAKQAERLAEVNEDLREQADQVKAKARELKQLNVAQSGLFTNLSHEFRTLLTLMVGSLDEIAVAESPEQALPQVLGQMRLTAGEMLHLVDQLMDTARLESGQYPLYITTGNLRDECRNVVHSFHVLAAQNRVDLRVSVTDAVPIMAWFDRDVVFKVLSNLLSNALKFTPPGGVVSIELDHDDEQYCLRVSDTGTGIPREELPRIFDRFHQVKRADGQVNGTGIGLALVRKLVRRHMGEVTVSSEEGVGTTFTVNIPSRPATYRPEDIQPPRKPARSPAPATILSATPAEEAAAQDPAPAGGQYQILVVEDNPQARALLCRQLRAEYNVVEAQDGNEGLEKALQVVPDLIITDRLMPGMDGLAFCRSLRSDSRVSHIPVIMLTAMTTQQQKIDGLGSGADLYLHKPFDRQEFALVVRKQLDLRDRMRKRFLQNVSAQHVPEELNTTDREFLQSLTDYVSAELEKDIDLTDLSRALGVSRTQLFRKMKALVGMSVTEFIRDYRLRRAFELLQSGEMRIGEVIQATGFNSRSYFYRSFKAKFGCRPTEIKNPEAVENSDYSD